jgi:hypothetical protein
MDIKDEVAALRQRVEALEDQLNIVLMMVAKPEHAPELTPVQESEPQIIHDYKVINFPI